MAKWTVTVGYDDGTSNITETEDGKAAIKAASSNMWEEDRAKTVKLERDGDLIYSERIKAYKPQTLGR